MKQIEIYTDGACSGNPGPGGWGAVLVYNGKEKELSGSEKETTNNRMELTAVIMALNALNQPCEVKLTTEKTAKHALNIRIGTRTNTAVFVFFTKSPLCIIRNNYLRETVTLPIAVLSAIVEGTEPVSMSLALCDGAELTAVPTAESRTRTPSLLSPDDSANTAETEEKPDFAVYVSCAFTCALE